MNKHINSSIRLPAASTVAAEKHFSTNALISLFVLALLICILRTNYYDWPANRDITHYAAMSHELVQGKLLYSDFWDIKPPAIFISYSLAEILFGYGPLALYMMNLGCALIILFGVYAAATAMGGRTAGLWAALFWTALSGDISLQINDVNTEAFINACLIWAFVLFFPPPEKPFGNRRALLIGLLFAWASFYKQAIIFIPILLSVGHIIMPPAGISQRQAVVHVSIIGAIGAALWGLAFVYMASTGRFQIFCNTIFTSAAAYAGTAPANIATAGAIKHLLAQGIQRIQVVVPLLVFASYGIVRGLLWQRSRVWLLITLYGIGALLSIAITGKFYRHYFQLGIPPLLVAGGLTAAIPVTHAMHIRRWLPSLTAAIVLFLIAAYQFSSYASDPEEKLEGSYADLYLVTQQLGKRLPFVLHGDETMYQWGAESGLYFFSQIRPPAPQIGWEVFMAPVGDQLSQQTLQALKASPPDLIILAKYFTRVKPQHPVQQWIQANYLPAGGLSDRESAYFTWMVRPGSGIESRLPSLPSTRSQSEPAATTRLQDR